VGSDKIVRSAGRIRKVVCLGEERDGDIEKHRFTAELDSFAVLCWNVIGPTQEAFQSDQLLDDENIKEPVSLMKTWIM